MAEKKPFYITTTLPYVNADPHIGFATELIRADIMARAKELQGFDVFFNTGTDEHGQKIWQKAQESGEEVQKYVDSHAASFKELISLLGIKEDIHFIRTTDPKHIQAAQEFWKRCNDNGDIYKKEYRIKYCVGCELEKTDSEIENGHCIIHPHLELEIREEENYFFKFSRYQEPLLDLYKKNAHFVLPQSRFNEIIAFVERGLQDFSISRLKSKMPWGVPVLGDEVHVMYVWFDALTSYISTLNWPESGPYETYWMGGTPVQYAGKDNLRQQSAMWQAMLMSAKLHNSAQIIIEGFINSNGQKMSKSLGNVVNPKDLVEEYGTDALRYYVAREFSDFEDSDFTHEKFKQAYNANLANGIGNLASRIMTLASANLEAPVTIPEWEDMSEYFELLNNFEINKAANYVWGKIGELDLLIQEKKPWESKDKNLISDLVIKLYSIARMLNPLMPETSKKIKEAIKANKKPENLFPRLNA